MAALEKDRIAAGGPDNAEKSFTKQEVAPLPSLPDSNVVSIMAGEGITEETKNEKHDAEAGNDDLDFDADDFLDSLIEGASELALGGPDDNQGGDTDAVDVEAGPSDPQAAVQANQIVSGAGVTDIPNPNAQDGAESELNDGFGENLKPYGGAKVARIADNLNRQNRLAKRSSMECQNLFLSLYFRDNEETAQGVVTSLRVNGFFVYVPKFDVSGPVYVRDVNGDVQIDPRLVGLDPGAGQEATMGFTSSSACRRFPSGQCSLLDAPDGSSGGDQLEVSVTGGKKKLIVRTVDVVTISLRCDNWDVRSRVPPPRFILVSKGSRPPPGFGQATNENKKITSQVLTPGKAQSRGGPATDGSKKQLFASIFDALQCLDTPPVLADVPLRGRAASKARSTTADVRHEEFKGRMIFHKFVNPDTKSATQEAAISAAATAAAQRRANAAETRDRRNEMDSTRSIERNIMARTQRLAADKRNTRRSKAK